MQKDLLAEVCVPNLELEKKENIEANRPASLCYTLKENYKHIKNHSTKLLPQKKVSPPMVSEVTAANNTISVTKKNADTVNGGLIVTKPFALIEKSFKNDNNLINLNSGIYELQKNSPKPKENSICYQLLSKSSNKSNGNVSHNGSSSKTDHLKVKTYGNKCFGVKSNSCTKKKPLGNVIFIKNSNGKSQFQIRSNLDSNKRSCSDLLPFNSNDVTSFTEEAEVITENVKNDNDLACENESEPFCVISEVIGNADEAFSGEIAYIKSEAEQLNDSVNHSSSKTGDIKHETNSSGVSSFQETCRDSLETFGAAEEEIDASFSDFNVDEESIVETEVVSLSEGNKGNSTNNIKSNVEVLETESVTSHKNLTEEIICNISDSNNQEKKIQSENVKENGVLAVVNSLNSVKQLDSQLITPKKTNDITKIKGWRRKQFLIEKPTTVEFYRIAKKSRKKIAVEDMITKSAEPNNVENAFVCDSLDEFLSGEIELKVGYEIPHLYAEVGIKLTSEDIASKPNLSEEDFKEVENRYCRSISPGVDITDLDRIQVENNENGKRPIEDSPQRTQNKFLKLMDSAQRMDNVVDTDSNPSTAESTADVKLETKLLGLVVYPGPLNPLHPIVRHHIRKLRSYSTRIDKNWANFAASAVFVNNTEYKRKILPAYCCVKIIQNAKVFSKSDEDDVVVNSLSKNDLPETVETVPKSTKYSKEKIKLKECSVVINKINLAGDRSPWCMEHYVYDCEPCGLSKTKSSNAKSLTRGVKDICAKKKATDGQHEELAVSSQNSFDVKIANLLARKLRALKFKGDTFTSIDCLKTLTPDSVEFIKLNFVKESFLKTQINVWYLKQQNSCSRSRAFLTFLDTPPVPNAVNLKKNTQSPKNLPKVITEIVSSDKVFSPNEYAILHCNGKNWEIHGSLNIAFENSDKNVEQIFASSHMPELEELQKVAQDILKIKAVKWWVVDLYQKFKLIEINFGNVVSIITRNRFIEMAKCESSGFMPIRQDKKGRILGAYIIQTLLPFVLMGPYYLVETHNMTVKGVDSSLSFMYYVKQNVLKDFPLKFFINSVIKDVEENDKVLDGMWLYDKMCLDNTSYIEVVTRNSESPIIQNKFASIDIEHGYSLNSLTNCLPSGKTTGAVNRKDSQEEVKKISVFLYFDVLELGYIEGELQQDNSVIISHPLDQRTKVKSHKVGDWFIRTIKRRIEFIPKDLEVKWFITKHKEDLRERRPFNKFLLGGAHVLTKNGVFYLLEMSESKIAKLGLEKNDVVKAITESQVIRMVLEMKNLAGLLPNKTQESLSMEKVLTLAIREIKELKVLEKSLENKKIKAEEKRLILTAKFVEGLGTFKMKNLFKLKMIENIERFFIKRNGELGEEFLKILVKTRLGRQYLRQNGKFYQYIEKVQHTLDSDQLSKVNHVEKCKKLQNLLSSFKQADSTGLRSLIKKSTTSDSKSPSTSNTDRKNEISSSLACQIYSKIN